MLDVHRDTLVKAGGRKGASGRLEIWSRPLADGSTAVALFNRGLTDRLVEADWATLGLSGIQTVRDVWQQRDLGEFGGKFSMTVPSHGAVLLRIGRAS